MGRLECSYMEDLFNGLYTVQITRFQKMCRISIIMDVLGKLFTYIIVKHFDAQAEENLPWWLVVPEVLTTLAEAGVKSYEVKKAKLREAPDLIDGGYLRVV